MPEICFWPAKTRKELKFLRCIQVLDLFLNCCSDINERTWIHYFVISLCWWIKLHHCLKWVFSICVSAFWLKFSRNSVSRDCSQKDSITELTTIRLILGFFWKMLVFRWLSMCLLFNLQELLKHVSLLTTSSFSITCLRCILVCSWNTLLLFSYRVL